MKKIFFLGIVFIFLSIGGMTPLAPSADAPRMTKEELKAMLGNPDLILLDVRQGNEWKESDLKIKGAVREDPDNIITWANKYSKDKTLVLYCA